jgi:hypothetical protein
MSKSVLHLTTLFRGGIHILSSEGFFVFFVRIIAYFRKEISWMIIRTTYKNSIMKKNINGIIMFFRMDDSGISKELAVYGTHEPVTTKILADE